MKMFPRLLFPSVVLMIASPLLVADSDPAEIQALKQQIEGFEQRVAALEATRTFTAFMPNFAERFHVMHRAGEAGDWAVASHEFNEMRRISELSTAVDPEKGRLMQSMMEPSFEALEEAIEHGNHEKFEKALNQTINTCNSCHTATGSEFIQVTLDASDSLSLRHPHVLGHRQAQGGHEHGMTPAMERMMKQMQEGMMSGGALHDDSEQAHDETEAHTD